MVEIIGEGFQIDIRGIHVLVEVGSSFGGDVPRSDGYGSDALLVARLRDINRVFCKDDGIVVSKGDRSAAKSPSLIGNVFRGRRVGELVPRACLADVPILAKTAAEIAAGGSKGEHTSSRQEVVQRFFLDRVDAESAAATIGRQHDSVFQAFANKTETALAFIQFAKPRT